MFGLLSDTDIEGRDCDRVFVSDDVDVRDLVRDLEIVGVALRVAEAEFPEPDKVLVGGNWKSIRCAAAKMETG